MANYSEVYGINKDQIQDTVEIDGIRQLTMNWLDSFPKATEVLGLKKLKARAMLRAISEGTYENGNHRIEYSNFIFSYYYRGTFIYKWDSYADTEVAVHAGEFEDTASTRNQRKEIQKSIHNFKEAVIRL